MAVLEHLPDPVYHQHTANGHGQVVKIHAQSGNDAEGPNKKIAQGVKQPIHSVLILPHKCSGFH